MLSQPAGGCWPTPEQELLLRAVLLRGETAAAAFAQWETVVGIDRLDNGSLRLLPVLSRALEREQIETAVAARLMTLYRQTWAQNQLRVRDLSAILPAFRSRGIPVVVLKGAA